jgi:hypothetical protein
LLVLMVGSRAAVAAPLVTVAPAPAWVLPERASVAEPAPYGGVAAVVLDGQTRHASGSKWVFRRGLERIVNDAGLQAAGQRMFSFVPPRQRLILHRLDVIRGGERRSHLDLAAVRVIDQESELENHVYQGEKMAIVVLPELRVGDQIAYEFSVVGENSVFGGHVMGEWFMALPMEVGFIRHRLISDHELVYRRYGGAPEVAVTTAGSLFEYSATAEGTSAHKVEPQRAPNHELLPMVQLTDFAAWDQVVRWGAPLFRPVNPSSKELRAFVEDVRGQSVGDEARALAVLRTVQKEVRYLSLAFSESTHRPASPDEVFRRRFGDCKDKTLLTVTLLRALGMRADPALVSSSLAGRLAGRLPSAALFDHVIVRLSIGDKVYWLDPTRLYQAGALSDVDVRVFPLALVLAEDATGLSSIEPRSNSPPDISARQAYVIETFGGATSLSLNTTFRHGEAEVVRRLRASQSEADFEQTLAAIAMRTYPRARRVGATSYDDRTGVNEVTVQQEFALESDWSTTDEGVALPIFPVWMRGELPSAEPERKTPIGLDHPRRILHATTVTMPRHEIKDRTVDVDAASFTMSNRRIARGDKVLSIYDDFAIRTPEVRVEELSEYRDAVSKAISAMDLVIVKGKDPPDLGKWPPLWLTLVCGGWAVALLGAVRVVNRRQPYLERSRIDWVPQYAGRKGWLALLGFGVSMTPLRLIVDTARLVPVLSATNLAALSLDESRKGMVPVLVFELVADIALVVVAFFVAYLYWAKRRTFPLMFVVMGVVSVTVTVLDQVLSSQWSQDDKMAFPSTFVSVVVAIMWMIYVLNSERVKATFLPEPRGQDEA